MSAEYRAILNNIADEYRRVELANSQLPRTGYVRLNQIIGSKKTTPPIPPLLPISRSTWLAGVKSGRFPQPIKGLGKRITAWRIQDILTLIQKLNGEHSDAPTEAAL